MMSIMEYRDKYPKGVEIKNADESKLIPIKIGMEIEVFNNYTVKMLNDGNRGNIISLQDFKTQWKKQGTLRINWIPVKWTTLKGNNNDNNNIYIIPKEFIKEYKSKPIKPKLYDDQGYIIEGDRNES